MTAQSFAPGEPHQTGAIALLSVPLIAQMVKLAFSNQRKPLPEIFAIQETLQFRRVWKAVVVCIRGK